MTHAATLKGCLKMFTVDVITHRLVWIGLLSTRFSFSIFCKRLLYILWLFSDHQLGPGSGQQNLGWGGAEGHQFGSPWLPSGQKKAN